MHSLWDNNESWVTGHADMWFSHRPPKMYMMFRTGSMHICNDQWMRAESGENRRVGRSRSRTRDMSPSVPLPSRYVMGCAHVHVYGTRGVAPMGSVVTWLVTWWS